jgi:sortase A
VLDCRGMKNLGKLLLFLVITLAAFSSKLTYEFPVYAEEEVVAAPVKLIINSIGLSAPVLGMSKTASGKMAVPNNYTEVGWYNLGPKPGEEGSAVFGAHVDNGGRIPGLFKNLKKVAVGDTINVFTEDGKALAFRVAERKVYNYRDKNTGEIFDRAGVRRLNLITCYGTWLPKEKTYNGRLVVFAELVEP